MSKVFRLKEILDLAIKKEQEAAHLYQQLVDEMPDAELKSLFTTLASQEHQHEHFYQDMSANVHEERSPGPKGEHEYSGFMKQMIDESRTVTELPDTSNMSAALDYAIARENDSVKFYTELKAFVAETAHEAIDKIIAEEHKHAEILAKVKEKLG